MWWLGLALVGVVAGSIDDNTIGGPEKVLPPEDTSSFIYNALSPFYYSAGTQHFVSPPFPEIDSRGFHGGMFDGIGDYYPSWQSAYNNKLIKNGRPKGQRLLESRRKKRSTDRNENETDESKCNTNENPSADKRGRGRSGRIVRGMEIGSSGFHDDIFNSGFGDFSTMKRSVKSKHGFANSHQAADENNVDTKKLPGDNNRPAEKNEQRFDGEAVDTVLENLDDAIRKRRPEMDAMGFHGDMFSRGFGDFDTMKKRRPEMDAMGFHGDTFSRGFGDFDTMKKRRPEMDAMGFHGDTFSRGFGDFDTMKKRRPEMDAMGFYGDTFGNGFGDFDTMKKRRPEMDAMGFHGDTFSRGFGDFDTMKKRRPEMDAMGFHGDTFSRGFGDFDTMKKRLFSSLPSLNTTGKSSSLSLKRQEIRNFPFQNRRHLLDLIKKWADTNLRKSSPVDKFHRGTSDDFDLFKNGKIGGDIARGF